MRSRGNLERQLKKALGSTEATWGEFSENTVSGEHLSSGSIPVPFCTLDLLQWAKKGGVTEMLGEPMN